jgi:hypothetical protein
MLKKELSLLVIISVICVFSINKDDGAYAAKNKSATSQNASSTTTINNELPNPPGPDNNGFFLRIIRPCPNIDYKMRVFTSIPDLDPGINLSGPNKNLVIPGASGQTCERLFPKSDVIQSNQVGIEQVLDQEGMSPTPVITKTNKIRILEIPHTCENSQLFYLSLPAKCLVSGHLITKQPTPNRNMIKIEAP